VAGPVERFVAELPKVELHLHLVGAAAPASVAALAARRPDVGVPADIASVKALFEFRDFAHFIAVYLQVSDLLRDGADLVELADGVVATLAAQRVRYAEITVTPYTHVAAGIAWPDVRDALGEARRRAARAGVEVAWCLDVSGDDGAEAAEQTARWAVEDPPDGLVSFGLGGREAGVDRAAFAPAFAVARAAGLRSVPHAGEADGATSIWKAVRDLGADRIGHGVRCLEDPDLVAHLVNEQIPLEVCPSSNVCTAVVAALGEHPLPRLVDAGLVVTLNSDDPTMFGTSISDEYRRVADTFGYGVDELAHFARSAVDAAFFPWARRRALHDEIDAALAASREADRDAAGH